MYKLKYTMQDNIKQIEEFESIQGVAERLKQLFETDNVAEIIRTKKELQVRIYLSYKK